MIARASLFLIILIVFCAIIVFRHLSPTPDAPKSTHVTGGVVHQINSAATVHLPIPEDIYAFPPTRSPSSLTFSPSSTNTNSGSNSASNTPADSPKITLPSTTTVNKVTELPPYQPPTAAEPKFPKNEPLVFPDSNSGGDANLLKESNPSQNRPYLAPPPQPAAAAATLQLAVAERVPDKAPDKIPDKVQEKIQDKVPASVTTLTGERNAAPNSEPASKPLKDGVFNSSIEKVTAERLGLSWRKGCPVPVEELRLVRVSYWGFDDAVHSGELVVHHKIADRTVAAFAELFKINFKINRMQTPERFLKASDFVSDGRVHIDSNKPDTLNNTVAFLCRESTVRQNYWSEHSYGLAIDINPVQNPYVSAKRVIPVNGNLHINRNTPAVGKIDTAGQVIRIMRNHGFMWGGSWRSAKDYMHFSTNGK